MPWFITFGFSLIGRACSAGFTWFLGKWISKVTKENANQELRNEIVEREKPVTGTDASIVGELPKLPK